MEMWNTAATEKRLNQYKKAIEGTMIDKKKIENIIAFMADIQQPSSKIVCLLYLTN